MSRLLPSAGAGGEPQMFQNPGVTLQVALQALAVLVVSGVLADRIFGALARGAALITLALPLGIPVQPNFEEFLRASDLMGVQRHLKVIGIFARICHRDGKPRYLADVPRFFSYIEAVLARRPELAELGELFSSLGLVSEVDA